MEGRPNLRFVSGDEVAGVSALRFDGSMHRACVEVRRVNRSETQA
ncbi:hypothetical protein ACFL5O_04785 [Myxococcota bacterium]